MMIFNMGVLGYTQSTTPTFVNIKNINKVTLENGICDEIYASNAVEDLLNKKPEWNADTAFYAKFQGNLFGGNVGYTLDVLSALRIKRRPLGSYKWITLYELTDIKEVEDINLDFKDITPLKIDYEYALVPVINNVEGEYVIQQIKPDFQGVFVVGQEKIFHTTLNINTCGDILPQRNFNSSTANPLGSKYPYVFYNGTTNFDFGTLSATYVPFLKDVCEWDFENGCKYRRELKDMLTDGRPKILKDDNGCGWLIAVIGNSITEQAQGHPYNVITSFDWNEIGNLESSNDLYFSGFINCNLEGS